MIALAAAIVSVVAEKASARQPTVCTAQPITSSGAPRLSDIRPSGIARKIGSSANDAATSPTSRAPSP